MNIKELIVYEDENIIALNKPSGILVIPDRFDKNRENLYDALKEVYEDVYVIHRIDRGTSGIILFAKNSDVHRNLSMLWEKGKVRKTYYALVHGKFFRKRGRINSPIGRLKKKKGIMTIDRKNGKKSITEYEVIKTIKNFSFLEITPHTGRTHQIRVHLASIGHPVAGDVLYNRIEATGKETFTDDCSRLCLHAYSVEFFYEAAEKKIQITAPLPEEILRYVKEAGLK
ncbi:MAG TPA: RluA family pseudouridine synthase [Candidatus Goldiibacteriota bacterium]|nr:RluA family pseudouridine synthase [Candidatus Goldiibacteriota bacterium]